MGIKVLRIYVENSVIGGCFDDEFKIRSPREVIDNE